jgi:formylglycine-generating enzyme required for sulfatase activity
MALVPGSTFEMGQSAEDIPKLQEKFTISRSAMFEEETPKHRATIDSFYIDRTEVTNAQFKRFIDQNPEWRKEKVADNLHNGKYLQNWNGLDFPAGQDNYPVVFVSWYAAAAYCLAQGKRLPTEAEWEFAARGGLEGKAFPWGDEMPDKARANFSESRLNAATAVASYPANGYGLFDMAGNVWEYLADEWQKYRPGATNGSAAADIFAGRSYLQVKTRRALRGGSYGGAPINLRVTYRDSHLPANAGDHVGFRCAMAAPVQSPAVNELLRLHHQARAAHFTRDARSIVSGFADDFTDIRNGRINRPAREESFRRLQNYLNNSTFLEWDDIAPPLIRVSDDATMGYVVVHKKVRLKAKQTDGSEIEETEVFAWLSVYQKANAEWKLVLVVSTNTPEVDK